MVEGLPHERLHGVWRELGGGRYLAVDGMGMAEYVETPGQCYAVPQPLGFLLSAKLHESSLLHGHVVDGRETVDIRVIEHLPVSVTLVREEALPAVCLRPPQTSPAQVFQAMWELFDRDYAFFAERGIDWGERYATYAPRAALAASGEALFDVMSAALQGFDDGHINLLYLSGEEPRVFGSGGGSLSARMIEQAFLGQGEIDDVDLFAANWAQVLEQQIGERLEQGGEHDLSGGLLWGRMAGNVGYIRLTRLSNYAGAEGLVESILSLPDDVARIEAALDRALAQLADTDALILDIAHNDGGHDHVSEAIASRFADRARLALTKTWRRPDGRAPQAWSVAPRGARQYLKPVYLLTGDLTVSAAEVLTLMMRTLPHVTHVGMRTQGILSDALIYTLPHEGFMVSLSDEIYTDPEGLVYESQGIPPQWDLPLVDETLPETLFSGHAAALDAIVARIRE